MVGPLQPAASPYAPPTSNTPSRAGASSPDAGAAISGAGASAQVGRTECKTCASRRYVDGSNDAGVSFKTPQHVAPAASAAAVTSHEREHVVREQAKAAEDGRKVVSQTVQIQTDVCPECGRTFVSGGVTRTVTAASSNTPAPHPGALLDRLG